MPGVPRDGNIDLEEVVSVKEFQREYVVLAIRLGEQIEFSNQPFEGEEVSYAVALVETPSFPETHHPESDRLAVICAGKYSVNEGELAGRGDFWGWVTLEAETKQFVGEALLEYGARPGDWVYMRFVTKT